MCNNMDESHKTAYYVDTQDCTYALQESTDAEILKRQNYTNRGRSVVNATGVV